MAHFYVSIAFLSTTFK